MTNSIQFQKLSNYLCDRFPFACSAIASFFQWFLERDTRMWQVINIMANTGVAFWIGWPGFHPYLGQSDFYAFLTRHFGDWKWTFTIFGIMGFGHLFVFLMSQIRWKPISRMNDLYGTVQNQAFFLFLSAVFWYGTFKLYVDDAVGGVAVVTSFCLCFGNGWSYLCLTVGKRAQENQLIGKLKRNLHQTESEPV